LPSDYKKIKLISDRSNIYLHYDVFSKQNKLGETLENVDAIIRTYSMQQKPF